MSYKKQLIHVLYGSETGIAESISEQIYEDSVSLGYNAVHHCLKDEGEKFHMSDLKIAIIVCSTTGDGDPPGNARKFVKKLLVPENSGKNILADMRYALLGLGDRQKTTIHSVGMYTDFKADESYTPNRLSILVGNDFNDLHEIEQVEIAEPYGWVWMKLQDPQKLKPVRAFMCQIAVLQNHQNGRDTHIRQIKVFGSTQDSASIDNIISGTRLPELSSVDCSMFNLLR